MKKILAIITVMLMVNCISVSAFADGAIKYNEYIDKADTNTTADVKNTYEINSILKDNPTAVQIEVDKDGYYKLGFNYKAYDEGTSDFVMGIKIDGLYPFEESAELTLPRMFTLSSEKRIDGLGNEFSPEVISLDEFALRFFIDNTGWSIDPYLFYFTAGIHNVEIIPKEGAFEVKELVVASEKTVEKYSLPDKNADMYNGSQIVLEGEAAAVMSSYWLTSKSDNSSASVSPVSNSTDKINYIGGSNWKTAGEYIGWKVDIKSSGYYQIGFSYRQSDVINGSTYRCLTIDGETPFSECEDIPFAYCTGWKKCNFEDDSKNTYLIYLEKGTHEIGLTVTNGPISAISSLLTEVVSSLGNLYMDITMITGDSPDTYRDYALFEQIPDMESSIKSSVNSLNKASKQLDKLSGKEGNAYNSSIKSMIQVLKKMLDNKYTAHRYVSDYYSKYCSLASALNDMRAMPLEIDKIILASPEKEIEYDHAGFFKQFYFSTKKFVASFIKDYNNISGNENADEKLVVWVNWGRDQAQILNYMIHSSFTEETKIPVDVKVVNATIVQSVLSGNQPDVILQQPRSEPVNLAMRNVLLDLTEFEDCDRVLTRFQTGADKPYRYKNGLYALPDTQTFYLMFYRSDVFKNLGIEVPKTWDEFIATAKKLARSNFDVWLPYTQITTVNQVNTGIGSLNLFSSLLLQRGLSLYSSDGRSSTLTDAQVISTFEYWTDFYTKLKVPVTMSFYNRFRVGTCPLGIEQYTNYTTLKAAAPEIDGLWDVAELPGTVDTDGNVNNATSGGGTGSCIMKATKHKDAAWELLKWWTSADTQYTYSNNLESVLGSTGRIAVSNIEAFEKLLWDTDHKDNLIKAWKNVQEIPEVPGSYYATRSVDMAFWNVVNQNKNPKDVLLKWGAEVDQEINRKWDQYESRQ